MAGWASLQPISISRGGVRGVNVDGVIRTLATRDLIEEVGRDPETGPAVRHELVFRSAWA